MSRDWSYVGDAARLREAAEHLLEAWDNGTHSVLNALEVLRAALAEPQTTHGADCYQWHHGCAVAEIKRLRTATTPAPRKSTCVYPHCVSTTRTTCDAWASGACEERI